MSTSLLLSNDPQIQEYLEELGRRMSGSILAYEQAAKKTPGSKRTETSNGDGTKRIKISVPLTTEAAFDAFGAALAFHARNARDIRNNETLMTATGEPPPGWNPLKWRALAKAVDQPEADADSAEGRERIVVAAMGFASRRRLEAGPMPTTGILKTTLPVGTSVAKRSTKSNGKKRGRKPEDRTFDERVKKAWDTNLYATHNDLAKALGVTEAEINASKNRYRPDSPL